MPVLQRRIARRHVAVLLLLLGPGEAARAEDAAIETVVVSARRTEQPADAVIASIRSVSGAEIDTVGAVHISEVLARVPGAWISRGNGQEHLTAIRSPVFTGAGSCGAFYLAEDGVPLRPAGFCNVNELSEVNSEQAARIEVLRGPGTAVHGANAQHGVINVISAPPPADGGDTRVALEGGPHGYTRALARLGHGNAAGGWLATLNASHDGGYKDDSGFDQQKLGLRFDHDWGALSLQSLLSVMNLEQDTAGFVLGEGAYRRSDRKRENPNPEAFRDNRTARWYGRFEWSTPAAGTLSLTPFLRWQEMRFLQHFLLGQPLEENGLRAAGLQSGWQRSLGPTLELVAGIDLEWSEGWLQETQREPVPGIGSLPAGRHYDYVVVGLDSAAYVQLEWQPGAAWHLVGGLRRERQDYDYDNRLLDGATRDDGSACIAGGLPAPCRYSRPADRSDRFQEWSWNLGARRELGEAQSLLLNLAHGFRPPQAAELYRLQAGQVVADIDSEQVDSVELGWRGQLAALDYSFSAYLMEKRNVIFQDSERRNVSGARTRHRGLEYSVAWELAPGWTVSADGTWALHTYDSDDDLQGLAAGTGIEGNEMDTAPHSLASVRLAWQGDRGTRAELEWQHMGRYYLDATESTDYPGHDLLHLRARHEFAQGWSLGARLTNLTDEDYAERADYAFGDYRYFVGEPRGLYLEVEWRGP